MQVSTPPPRRPRLLLPLGLVGYVYGVVGLIISWSTVTALAGSQDRFLDAVGKDPARVLGIPSDLGTSDERQRAALRNAQALWSRRQVLLPLAGINAIASILVLLGVARTIPKRSRRAGWGRSAWQLGLLIWLPCLALDTIVAALQSRELLAALADLHDPVADQLRAMLALRSRFVLAQAGLSALYLAGTAAYLSTRTVVEACRDDNGGRASSA
jgi:hypothetical protein